MFAVGILLSTALVAFGVGTAVRQRRTMLRLRDERFLPTDERGYLRGQVRRRLITSAAVTLMGAMIGWSYLSGTEAHATAIAERSRKSAEVPPEHDPGRPADEQPPPPSEEDKAFVKRYGYFWIAVLVLVFLAMGCAIFDFWATRCYWMDQYRIIKADHEAKLQRDLAVYRQAKDNDRVSGLGKTKPEDETDEQPPVE